MMQMNIHPTMMQMNIHPPKKNPGSATAHDIAIFNLILIRLLNYVYISTYLMLIFFVSPR